VKPEIYGPTMPAWVPAHRGVILAATLARLPMIKAALKGDQMSDHQASGKARRSLIPG
jgi:hypothetical protein